MGAVVPREMPNTAPRAEGSQSGAPSPVSAGTKMTPPGVDRSLPDSFTDATSMMPNPSRSHWMAARSRIPIPPGRTPVFHPPAERDGRQEAAGVTGCRRCSQARTTRCRRCTLPSPASTAH